jgi:hypothetical protein
LCFSSLSSVSGNKSSGAEEDERDKEEKEVMHGLEEHSAEGE